MRTILLLAVGFLIVSIGFGLHEDMKPGPHPVRLGISFIATQDMGDGVRCFSKSSGSLSCVVLPKDVTGVNQ